MSYQYNKGRNNSYDNNRNDQPQRHKSYGDRHSYSSRVDTPLGSDRYNNNRRHSYGGHDRNRGNFQNKPKKPASMIEHKEPVLASRVKLSKDLLVALSDLSTLGSEDNGDMQSRVKVVAEAMCDEDDLKEYSEQISDIFVDCLTTLPVQVSSVATLLSLIYKKDPMFMNTVLDKLILQKFTKSIQDHDITSSKIILRAIASMVSSQAISADGPGGLCTILDSLVTIAYSSWHQHSNNNNNNTTNSLSVHGQEVIYLLASTIPWMIHSIILTNQGMSLLDRMLPLFSRVLTEWCSPYSAGGPLAVFHIDSLPDETIDEFNRIHIGPAEGPVCWDTLWEACKCASDLISQLKADQSSTSSPMSSYMICPWIGINDEDTSAEANVTAMEDDTENTTATTTAITSNTTTPMPLSSVMIDAVQSAIQEAYPSTTESVPSSTAASISFTVSKSSTWLKPCYSIFDSNSSEQAGLVCQQLSKYDKWIIMDYYRDIMYFFEPIIRYDGTYVGTVNTLAKQLLAVQKLAASTSDTTEDTSSTTVSLEYILVECVLVSLSMTTAASNHYGELCRILLELCKLSDTVPPVLALGMSIVYQLGVDMDTTVWRTYASWLAYHLINTKLNWPYWVYWAEEYTQEGSNRYNHENHYFLKYMLDKCGHAIVAEQVIPMIPIEFQGFIHTTHGPCCPLFDASLPNEDGSRDYGVKLMDMMNQREEAETIEEWLETLTAPVVSETLVMTSPREASEEVTQEDIVWKLNILIQTIFEAGKSTLSSLYSLLDRYTETVRMYADTEEAQKMILETVMGMYIPVDDGYGLHLILDTLIRRGIVQVNLVIAALCHDIFIHQLSHHPWIYNYLEITLDRTIDSVHASAQHYMTIMRRHEDTSSMPMISEGTNASEETTHQPAADDDDDDNRRDQEDDDENNHDREGDEPMEGDTVMPRKQRRLNDTEHMDTVKGTDEEEEEETDPVKLAESSVITAFTNARLVSRGLIVHLLRKIALYTPEYTENVTVDSDTIDQDKANYQLTAYSLLLRSLRILHSTLHDEKLHTLKQLNLSPDVVILVKVEDIMNDITLIEQELSQNNINKESVNFYQQAIAMTKKLIC